MSGRSREIGVIHLVWVPLGVARLKRFLASYAGNRGGIEHELVVIFNGFGSADELKGFREALAPFPHRELPIQMPGLDIASYLTACDRVDHRFLCFLNSYSVLRDGDWLAKMYRHITRDDVGLVGATGSWASLRSHYQSELAAARHAPPAERLRRGLRLARYARHFDAFPNAHVRTTGFLIARDVFRGVRRWPMRRKMDTLRFESGRQGLTRQVSRLGLRALVVGRDGRGYEREQWAHSECFWQADQGNLLIADNRTEIYQDGDDSVRCHYSQYAWGGQSRPLLRGSGLPPS